MPYDLYPYRAALSRANPAISIGDQELAEIVDICRDAWPNLERDAFIAAVVRTVLATLGYDHQLPVGFNVSSASPFPSQTVHA